MAADFPGLIPPSMIFPRLQWKGDAYRYSLSRAGEEFAAGEFACPHGPDAALDRITALTRPRDRSGPLEVRIFDAAGKLVASTRRVRTDRLTWSDWCWDWQLGAL